MIHFRSFKNTLPLSRACGLYLPDGHILLYIFLLKILLLMLQRYNYRKLLDFYLDISCLNSLVQNINKFRNIHYDLYYRKRIKSIVFIS